MAFPDYSEISNKAALETEIARYVEQARLWRTDYETGILAGLQMALKILEGSRCTHTCNANLSPGSPHSCSLSVRRSC